MKRNALAVATVVLALGAGTTLLATMDEQKQFKAAYPDAKTLHKCSTCHEKALPKKEDAGLNAYGKDMKTKATTDKPKVYDFKKIESLDSDGDGVKNADEIKAGTNPGDKTSK